MRFIEKLHTLIDISPLVNQCRADTAERGFGAAGNVVGGAINWWMRFGAKYAYENYNHSSVQAKALTWLERFGPNVRALRLTSAYRRLMGHHCWRAQVAALAILFMGRAR